MTKPFRKVMPKAATLDRAENFCRMHHIPISRTDLARIILAKRPDGRPRYFWSKDIVSPRGGVGYVLVDMGDFEDRLRAAIRHYELNKPLVIRGQEVTDEQLLDPGFTWGDEEYVEEEE